MDPFGTAVALNSLPRVCREHSALEWEDQRQLIEQLYFNEDKTLKEVMPIMETKYGFFATERQYKQRIKKWNLDKNLKDSDMKVILRKQLKRKVEANKESDFLIHGHKVQPHKIEKYMQRKKACPEEILASYILTPPYISCLTPPSADDIEESVERTQDLTDEAIQASHAQPRTSRDSPPSVPPHGVSFDLPINANVSVITGKVPVATNIFGLRATFSRKISRSKYTDSDLSPSIAFLRDISRNVHLMRSWYEILEKLDVLQLLHVLGEAILAVTQQGLDDPQKDGYPLLCHEIQRSRLTINGFFDRYHTKSHTSLNSAAGKYQWKIWVRDEFSKLKVEMLPQIESIELLTLVDQMAQLGTNHEDSERNPMSMESIEETSGDMIQRINIDPTRSISLLEKASKNKREGNVALEKSDPDSTADVSTDTMIKVDFMAADEVPWIYLSCLSTLRTSSKRDIMGMENRIRYTWTCCECENGGPYETRYVSVCLECNHPCCDDCEISTGCSQCGLSLRSYETV